MTRFKVEAKFSPDKVTHFVSAESREKAEARIRSAYKRRKILSVSVMTPEEVEAYEKAALEEHEATQKAARERREARKLAKAA